MAKTTKATTPRPNSNRKKSSQSAASTISLTEFSSASVSETEIARRAFEVYCARGGQHGRDLDDWLQAERELRTTVAASSN